jgi:hypothetical protein
VGLVVVLLILVVDNDNDDDETADGFVNFCRCCCCLHCRVYVCTGACEWNADPVVPAAAASLLPVLGTVGNELPISATMEELEIFLFAFICP